LSFPLFSTQPISTSQGSVSNLGTIFINCPSYTSIFISLLICLINSSLLPSQKKLLRNLNIVPLLVTGVGDVCFTAIFFVYFVM
jgi:hypothetical protein